MQYTVQAAARATGVSASRLRTWERRYGVPSPGRSPTGRRLYEEEDLALVRRMAALIDRGIPAAQAAEAALSRGAAETERQLPEPLHERARSIVEATATFDDESVSGVLREAVEQLGWGPALDRVVFAALEEIGARWRSGDVSPAHEHFASELIRRDLAAAIAARADRARGGPRVLLACVEDERHDLGLLALWLMLLDQPVRVTYLGADLPTGELLDAAERLRPDAIVLSATARSSQPMLAVAARRIIAERRGIRLFVGGPAMNDPRSDDVPGTRLPESLAEAAATVAAALGTTTSAGTSGAEPAR